MQTITKKILLLSILSLVFILNGCSSKEIETITDTHIVSEDYNGYGLVENKEVDARIEEAERLSKEDEIDPTFVVEDPSWTTKLVLDPDAVTADKYVEKEPVITYKYKFDKKFYKEARWRSANE